MAVTQPPIVWRGAHTNNYAKGRRGIALEALVLHLAEGSMAGIDAWFNDPRAAASTHFAVSKTGAVHQYVDLADTAYAHGNVEVTSTQARKLILDNWGLNPNLWAVGIEFEGTTADVRAGTVPAPAQEEAAARLGAWLFAAHLFPSGATDVAVDREHVLMHRDISPRSRTCPVWGEDVQARIIRRIAALLAPAPLPDPRDARIAELSARVRSLEDLATVQAAANREIAARLQMQADNLESLVRRGG